MNFDELQEEAKRKWAALEEGERPCIRVGAATCGLAAGAEDVIKAIEEEATRLGLKIKLLRVGCIGSCYAEPIIDIKKKGMPRIFYSEVTPEKARALLQDYLVDGNPRADLAMGTIGGEVKNIPKLFDLPMFKPQVRIVLENCGHIDPHDIYQYVVKGGFKGLKNALDMAPEEVVSELKNSGLRGRGGAGFPTGLKWEFCRKAAGSPKYIICNADEGDPGAFMDRSVLESDPFRVLEGMLIGAYAIGASEGYIYCRAEYPLAIDMLESAMAKMEELGLLGDNILGTDFSFHLKIFKGAGAFVCGEETALIASIEGYDGRPRPRPPFPAQSGVFGKPTNINNVETWANVPWILRNGAEKFSVYGTEKSKGNKTFALAGQVNRTGLIEVPLGITINEIVFDIGGGIPNGKKFKAIQTGGPSGGCIPFHLCNNPVDYETLAALGSIMGSGGMVVMDENTCMVDIARYFLDFTREESCGQCLPCREGSKQMYRILDRITKGNGKLDDIDKLLEVGEVVKDTSLCGLGQTLPNPVLTTVNYFKEEYIEHIKYKRCEAGVCKDIVYAPCQNACPLGQDVPSYVGYIALEKFDKALEVILKDNPLPNVLGRICDHPCTLNCQQADAPIAARCLKRFVADGVRYPRTIETEPRKGKKVAIVGSGPGGLSAAYFLVKKGYEVKIFEKLNLVGGMLRTCIPEYRLPKNILYKEIQWLKSLGIEIQMGVTIGKDVSIDELFEQGYGAVFIATGMDFGTMMGIPGEDAEGVMDSISLLKCVNLGEKIEIGENVVVIGGGNSAIDAARVCRRLNKQVKILYRRSRSEMPCIPEEADDAIEEGLEIQFLTNPVRIIVENSKVTGIECIRMKLGSIDKSGRRSSIKIEGSEFTIPTDTVIVAIGQKPDSTFLKGSGGLELTNRGILEVDPHTMATSKEGVFAGGDLITGPATVAEAAANGKTAAESIDRYLSGKPLEREYKVEFPTENVELLTLSEEELATLPGMPCVDPPTLPARECWGSFREIEFTITPEQAITEAKRCLRCDIRYEEED